MSQRNFSNLATEFSIVVTEKIDCRNGKFRWLQRKFQSVATENFWLSHWQPIHRPDQAEIRETHGVVHVGQAQLCDAATFELIKFQTTGIN